MYLEWKIPSSPSHVMPGRWIVDLRDELHKWSDQYNIPYNTKYHKLTYRVTFDDDQTYSLFLLSWNPRIRHENFWPELKDPMKIDRHR